MQLLPVVFVFFGVRVGVEGIGGVGVIHVAEGGHVEAGEGLSVSLDNYSVILDGKQVEMPPKEIELLFFLASREGKVFTREQLLEQVWGFDFFGDSRTVDVHVKRIREKIGERPDWELKTVWGVGYKFEAAK